MAEISFKTGKPIPSFSSEDLDKLLTFDISATKEEIGFSATKISVTKQTNDISATKISATKYMNNYKREHYDTLRIDLPKGSKEFLKQEAIKRNISVTKLVSEAISYFLENK